MKYFIVFIIFLGSTNLIYLSPDILDFLSSLDYLLQIVDDSVSNDIRGVGRIYTTTVLDRCRSLVG